MAFEPGNKLWMKRRPFVRWIKGKHHSAETRDLISASAKKRFSNKDEREKASVRQLEFLKHNKSPFKGHRHSEKTKVLMRTRAIERFKRPGEIRRVLSSRRPTNLEQRVIEVIQKYSLPYKYTGDGTFLIGQFNPDFVNTNSQKIALDIFGDRWHTPNQATRRKTTFAEYGWSLIIIWGHEMKYLSEIDICNRLTAGGSL